MTRRGRLSLLLLVAAPTAAAAASAAASGEHQREPRADPKATLRSGRARFTVLTNRLLRLELSKREDCAAGPDAGCFDDRATLAVVNRRLPVRAFRAERHDNGRLVLTTDALQLDFDPAKLPGAGAGFGADSLRIKLLQDGVQTTWVPGQPDPLNLRGTMDHGPAFAGSLDCYSTPEECDADARRLIGPGLLSRSGWAVVNETNASRFELLPPFSEESAWVDGSSTREAGRPLEEDLYFLAAGSDYTRGLADWALVSGRPALPPYAALGVWFSHTWVFSAESYMSEVVEGYESRGLPLQMAAVDMDWHQVHFSGEDAKVCNGWGGYTPNSTLFPDFLGFIKQLHDRNLPVILNMHQQTGVNPCEARYAAMAKALKLPETFVQERRTIDCAFDNKTFVEALRREIFQQPPMDSVDFFWNDWPGCATEVTGWGPQQPETLFWMGQVMGEQQAKRGRRPVLLSRYGGLGSQRQGIGFSGDTFQNFSALAWEVEMTPTASNVLFGLWSHDIGGFHNGTDNPGDADPKSPWSGELMLRWAQFGLFSPIFRTHGEYTADRYVWHFSTYEEIRQLMLLRNALVPHLYTLVRHAYDTAVSMLRPMYYAWPHSEEAYSFKSQYMHGDSVLVSPVAAAVDAADGKAAKPVWLPPGSWLSFDGRTTFLGDRVLDGRWALEEVPVFVRAGAVLPLRTMASARSPAADPLVWAAWLGDATAGEGRLYEDDGDGFEYQHSGWATTKASFTRTSDAIRFTVHGAEGRFARQARDRGLVLQLRALGRAVAEVRLGGAGGTVLPRVSETTGLTNNVTGWHLSDAVGHEGSWVEPAGALVVGLGRFPVNATVQVAVIFSKTEYV